MDRSNAAEGDSKAEISCEEGIPGSKWDFCLERKTTMKISDTIYSQIIDFKHRNTYFIPSAFQEGEYIKVYKDPSRIYLGRGELMAIRKDPEWQDYYHLELRPDAEKRDTVFNLALYIVEETSHIFIA